MYLSNFFICIQTLNFSLVINCDFHPAYTDFSLHGGRWFFLGAVLAFWGVFFGGRGIADFRDAKRKVYFHKDISLLTQSHCKLCIPVTVEDTNSMDFRTPKDHADKYFGEEKAQPEEKGACLWQRNTGEARQTTEPQFQPLFQPATALFCEQMDYETFALHFQSCWKA